MRPGKRRTPPRTARPIERGTPPGSAGVPPAFVSALPPASPPPRSIGKHATDLLRPSLRRSRCQGSRLPHRRHTEQLATAVHAGETPALPGGPHSVTASQQRTSIGIRVYSWFVFKRDRQFHPRMIRTPGRGRCLSEDCLPIDSRRSLALNASPSLLRFAACRAFRSL